MPDASIDLLVHPFFGRDFGYGVDRGIPDDFYRDVGKMLRSQRISERDYEARLTELWVQRFKEVAGNPSHVLGMFFFYKEDPLQDWLVDAAQRYLLGRTVIGFMDDGSDELVHPLLAGMVAGEKITVHAYGELSAGNMCVDYECGVMERTLREQRKAVRRETILSLSGDRVEGKYGF